MKTTVLADYKAKTSTGSRIHVQHNDLPIDVNRMIVWMMSNPHLAVDLIPAWQKIPEKIEVSVCDLDVFEDLARENISLTELLDEGQSLVADACSEPLTLWMVRELGEWVNRVNKELYKQARRPMNAKGAGVSDD